MRFREDPDDVVDELLQVLVGTRFDIDEREMSLQEVEDISFGVLHVKKEFLAEALDLVDLLHKSQLF